MTTTTIKPILRANVRSFYDLQAERINVGLRIVQNFKAKLGGEPSVHERELDNEAKKLLVQLHREFKRMTDGVIGHFPKLKEFEGTELISDYGEMCLIAHYLNLEEEERNQLNRIQEMLPQFSIYTEFLKDVRGCGPTLSAVLISEFDIHKAKYPSSLFKYAGLDVGPDGKGRSNRKEHLILRKYIDKKGEEKEKLSVTYNPPFRAKLLKVLGDCFIKGKSPYKEFYDNEKNRLENHATYKDTSKMHRHRMAVRKMIKFFLIDLYKKWRELEGLEVHPPYHVAKLGYADHGGQAATVNLVNGTSMELNGSDGPYEGIDGWEPIAVPPSPAIVEKAVEHVAVVNAKGRKKKEPTVKSAGAELRE